MPGEEFQPEGQGGEQDGKNAEHVGGVALSDEDKAKLTALNDDPEHSRGNKDLAYEEAHAEVSIRQMIDNLKASNIPGKEKIIEKLEKDGEELVEKAKEQYLKAERNYSKVREDVLGQLMLVMSEQLENPEEGLPILQLESTDSGWRAIIDSGLVPLFGSGPSRIINEIFTIAGIDTSVREAASARHADLPDDEWEKIRRFSNIPGLNITEERLYDKEGSKGVTNYRVVASLSKAN